MMNSPCIGFLIVQLLIASSFAQHNFGFNPKAIHLNESEGGFSLVVGSIDNSPFPASEFVQCFITDFALLPATLKFRVGQEQWQDANAVEMFEIDAIPQNITIEYRADDDKQCDDKVYTVEINCFQDGRLDTPALDIINPSLVINVKNTDPASMCQDPHLTQKVRGVNEDGKLVTYNICYDLFGKTGDQMELMTDNILGTSIVFELRDDYYIGKIFYATKLGYFNFTTTMGMTCRNCLDSQWGKEGRFVVGKVHIYPYAIVTQHKEDIVIEYKEEMRSQTVRIVKIEQEIGKNYLNILIEKSSNRNGVFDELHGGIFGFIANQRYEFYHPVQNLGSSTAKVNGRFVKTFLRGKHGQTDRCFSMSLDDLLYPKNTHFFRKSL